MPSSLVAAEGDLRPVKSRARALVGMEGALCARSRGCGGQAVEEAGGKPAKPAA